MTLLQLKNAPSHPYDRHFPKLSLYLLVIYPTRKPSGAAPIGVESVSLSSRVPRGVGLVSSSCCASARPLVSTDEGSVLALWGLWGFEAGERALPLLMNCVQTRIFC